MPWFYAVCEPVDIVLFYVGVDNDSAIPWRVHVTPHIPLTRYNPHSTSETTQKLLFELYNECAAALERDSTVRGYMFDVNITLLVVDFMI